MPGRDVELVEVGREVVSRAAGMMPTLLMVVGLAAACVVLVGAGSGRSGVDPDGPREVCRALLLGRECPVFSLAWSPDGRTLGISGFGPIIRLWDRETGGLSTIEAGTDRPRFLIGLSDEGRRLVVGGLDEPVEAWEIGPGPPSGRRQVARPEGRASADRLLAAASGGSPIRVRGPIEERSRWLPASMHTAVSAAFAPDGRSIATAEIDHSVRVWDAPSGELRHTFVGDWRGFGCVAFSPDGSKIAAGGGGSAKVWDAASGRLLTSLGDASGGSAVLAFSPDGRSLAVAGWDGAIRVWDLASGRERSKLGGHDGQVLAMAWSPDARTIATGGYDSTVRLWSVADPVEMARVDGSRPGR